MMGLPDTEENVAICIIQQGGVSHRQGHVLKLFLTKWEQNPSGLGPHPRGP